MSMLVRFSEVVLSAGKITNATMWTPKMLTGFGRGANFCASAESHHLVNCFRCMLSHGVEQSKASSRSSLSYFRNCSRFNGVILIIFTAVVAVGLLFLLQL
ncbi:hypothetical protein LY78DRAFT_79709 [Colletotrichum sublineola]|nr:hypothetical protein LY78DRAFT_79709 [Colletotrichum sublineola]